MRLLFFPGDYARTGSDSLTQAAASTLRTVFGAATATFNSALAAPLGSRLPCS